MLDTCEVAKVLVIAPLRVAKETWPAEAEKWDHLKDLDVSAIVGDQKTVSYTHLTLPTTPYV